MKRIKFTAISLMILMLLSVIPVYADNTSDSQDSQLTDDYLVTFAERNLLALRTERQALLLERPLTANTSDNSIISESKTYYIADFLSGGLLTSNSPNASATMTRYNSNTNH